MNKHLSADFYLRTDPVQIARELLGKLLVTHLNGERTSGRIVETEAYRAPDDRASHAFGNRRTVRTEVMFLEGGHAYIYLCYGIHHLFNVVTGPKNWAHAVLIRGIEPVDGLDCMLERRGFLEKKPNLTAGPGAISQALGLDKSMTGTSLLSPKTGVWIEEFSPILPEKAVIASPRIGVGYAKECAEWPWRFSEKGNVFVSKPRPF